MELSDFSNPATHSQSLLQNERAIFMSNLSDTLNPTIKNADESAKERGNIMLSELQRSEPLANNTVDSGEAKSVSIKDFISCFYGSEDTVYLRLLHDKKDPSMPAKDYYPRFECIEQSIFELQRYNNQGYGIFMSINGAKLDKDVEKIAAQFYESDSLSFEEQFERINKFPLRPSLIVKTRKSLHVYFLVKNAEVAKFRGIQKRLAAHFEGDSNICNESRVMRLPFFHHNKQEPYMCELIEYNPELIYSQEQIEDCLPDIELTKEKPDTEDEQVEYKLGTDEQMNFLLDNCDFMRHCKEHASFLSENDWYSMITNLALFKSGHEKIHELSREYPRYDTAETDIKIQHFLTSSTNPIRCDTIAERGFVCKKLGCCKCKSPAGMPFTEKQYPWYETSDNGTVRFSPGLLANYLAVNMRFIYVGEQFYIFTDGFYKRLNDYEVQKIIKDHLIIKRAKTTDINDTLFQLRLNVFKRPEEINTNPDIINVKNGLLNIKTGELMPVNPDYLSTIRINTNYNPKADCPKLLAFLNETLEAELIPVVREMIGYCISQYNDAQKCFLLNGAARSGKSTLIKIIENLVGLENCSNVPLQSLGDRFATAELYNKLINSCADLSSIAITNSGTFKALIGGDLCMAERKNRDPFSFRNTAKLLFSSNQIPRNISDQTEGFFRRLLIIPFMKSVPEDRINIHLIDDLLAEIDGIFNWAYGGLKELIDRNFLFANPPAVERELTKYRIASNNTLSFIKYECELNQDGEVLRDDLYKSYTEYCYTNGFHPMSNPRFNQELELHFKGKIYKGRDIKTRRHIWRGLCYIGSYGFDGQIYRDTIDYDTCDASELPF